MLIAVEFEAVLLVRRVAAPGTPVPKVQLVLRVVPDNPGRQFGGPKLNVGNANDDVFVIVGVTLAIVVKLSG